MPPTAVLHIADGISFRTHRSNMQVFLERHVARQCDYFAIQQARKNLNHRRIGDAHFDIASVQTVALHYKHESLAAIDVDRAARNHEYTRPLTDVNPHVDRRVRDQIQTVVGYRAEQFTDVACAMGNHLFRDHLGAAGPYAVGMRVPENLHRLIEIDLPEFGFINKCANTHVVQVGHLGEQISLLHEITLADWQ